MTVTLGNTNPEPGYVPVVDLVVPPGIAITGATALGTAAAVSPPLVFGGPTVPHPITGLPVSGAAGQQLYVVRLPASSLTSGVGAVPVTISFQVQDLASVSVGAALPFSASCGFAFGADSLNNPVADAPVYSAPQSASTTPRVMLVTSRFQKANVCQGAVEPTQQIVTVDVAEGVTLSAPQVSAVLDSNLRATAAVTTGGGTVTVPTGPGGTVLVAYGSVVGAAGADLTITIDGRVEPGTVAQATPGTPVTVPVITHVHGVGSTATGVGYTRAPGSDTAPAISANASVRAHAMRVDETLTTSTPTLPGQNVTVALRVCVASDFSLETVTVASAIPDGAAFVAGSGSPTTPTLAGSTLTFTVGNLGPGTVTTYGYQLALQQTRSDSSALRGGDTLATVHTAAGRVGAAGAVFSATDGNSGLDAAISIAAPTGALVVAALNGGAAPSPLRFVPGDVVTYQLDVALTSGDQGAVTIDLFLPRSFNATERGASGSATTSSGSIRLAAAHTASAPVPWTSSAAQNRLTFTVPTTTATAARTIRVLVDLTATTSAVEGDLRQTAILRFSAATSTATPVTGLARLEATLDPPQLTVTVEPPLVTGVDAGDTRNYTLRVVNTGRASAYLVNLRQLLPANVTATLTGVANGAGDPLTYTGDLISSNLVLTDPVPTTGGGLNTVVVSFTVSVGAVPAAASLTLTGRAAGWQNEVGTSYGPAEGTATLQTKPYALAVARAGGPTVTIGTVTTHTATITVPEGSTPTVQVDLLADPELFIDLSSISISASPGISVGAQNITQQGNGARVTWASVANSNTGDSGTDTLTVTYGARVANVAASQDDDDAVDSTVELRWNGGQGPQSQSAPAMDIEEPTLAFALTTSPPGALQAGDTATWTATVTVPAGVTVPAYDVTAIASPNADLTVTSVTVTGVTGSSTVPSGVKWTSQALGQTAVVTVSATIEDTATLGGTVAMPIALTWRSLPEPDPNARTGAGGVNDYARSVAGSVSIRADLTLSNTLLAVETSSETIGDIVEYQLTAILPRGTYGNLQLTHTLPVELGYVAARDFDAGDLRCGSSACALPAPTISGNDVIWSFGQVKKSKTSTSSLTFVVRTHIRNIATAVAGLSFRTTLDELGSSPVAQSALTTVKEPALSASTTFVAPAAVDGGDAVVLTGTVSNPAGATAKAAYDVAVTHTMTGLVPASVSSNCALASTVPSNVVTFSSIPVGTTCTYSLVTDLDGAIAANSHIQVTSQTTWTSREGVDANERNGSGTPAYNNYQRAVTFPEIVTLGGTSTLATGASSEGDTIPPVLFAGESVVYDATITVPDGLSPLTELVFQPPPGVRLVSAMVDATGFSGTIGALALGPGSRTSGQPVRLLLNNVNALSTPGQIDNTFHVYIDAAGTFDARNRVTSTGQVRATLTIGSGTPVSVPAGSPQAVELRLPKPALALAASRTDAGAGASFDLTATLTNAPLPAGPVCDSKVTVTVPAVMTVADPANDTLDNDGDTQVDEADENTIEPGAIVELPVAGCVATSRALALRITVTGHAPLPHVDVQATLDRYYTLADAARREHLAPATDAFDSNGDGASDELGDERAALTLRPDSDSDGASDATERAQGSSPLDADSDDDGVLDGAEPQAGADSDGDGLINALDADSDNDGLFDGTERGVTTRHPDTRAGAPSFIPDANPATTTDPLDRDSDDGGRTDGAEDSNHNGAVEAGERDPRSAGDDAGVADSDGDGLANAEETALGTSPSDNDSDDDGVLDGLEPNYTLDVDGDGLPQPLDADSDGDGVLDGTEQGATTPVSGTDQEAGHYRADADAGATRTSPLLADHDRGGERDGEEDPDRNGRVDAGERDPRNPGDDAAILDFDSDGWSDALEARLGTSALDPDSDDDGVEDGAEPDGAVDSDGDGLMNALDADSDNDGLFDGTELGVAAAAPRGTSLAAGRYRPDADPATRTSAVRADTDGGGATDGSEDADRDGLRDAGETDPLVRADDAAADSDGDGLGNALELALGLDPQDADCDDDGLADGTEANFALDADGDGAISALDADSDNDGLYDGTERGRNTPVARTLPLRGTDTSRGLFVADANTSSRTKMLVADTDGGGVRDGAEDRNKNGAVDAGETDPLVRADDAALDTDGDGLVDSEEQRLRSNPNDSDSDDDGVRDGDEPDYAADGDGDELPNVLDVDSDDDGLYDGTELGVTSAGPGTDLTRHHFVADADPGTRTSPVRADTDGGGVRDGDEDLDGDGQLDAGELDPRGAADDSPRPADSDGDGLSDALEARLGTRPADADSDDDGVRDGDEPNWRDDADGDGLINALDADSDDDLLLDGTESSVTTAGAGTDLATGAFIADGDPATHTNPLSRDTDGGNVRDGVEDLDRDGVRDAGETNPVLGQGADDGSPVDTDGDGLPDALEVLLGALPGDADSDDDGVADGAEPNLGWDADHDGLAQLIDPDSDDDGLFDGTERGVTAPGVGTNPAAGNFRADLDPTSRTQMLLRDTDGGGTPDGAEDFDKNGALDSRETDPNRASDDNDTSRQDGDSDGLTDLEERAIGTNPADADSDDDGVRDGGEPNLRSDADGDGLISPLDADSDGDGVFDGTELGLTAPDVVGATDLRRGAFVPDANPATRTAPQRADTDRGGVRDGAEDANHNGAVDGGETNPLLAADDVSAADGDGDGLSDREEVALGTSPTDADSDDDGLADGAEPNWGADSDGDGLINARDSDSDNDHLFDGTEAGVTAAGPGTDVTRGAFRADTDPGTRTSPLRADSDGGGVQDGSEDIDRDGAFDGAPETDPNLALDDVRPRDSDGDGLPDAEEVALGTSPSDSDSDDDGVLDGLEPNLVADSDGDGLVNPLDPDSDDDGLFDGTELGVTAPTQGTDRNAGTFVPDVDSTTTTNPLAADSDGGGVPDGAEDPNGNGQVQAGETNPRSPGDDATAPMDRDGDGLSDAQEMVLGTSATDGDSDDDGVLDGDEQNPYADTDRDGLDNPLDGDSDGDGVLDGTERGVVLADLTPDTDRTRGRFVADADPLTLTFALVRDSDRGGVIDGLEDRDGDGAREGAESDPLEDSDDDVLGDADGDTIYDVVEDVRDSDGDGERDFVDLDADGDRIPDAVEAGDADLATAPRDLDGDRVPDYRDLDADGDTVLDREEAGDGDPATPPRDSDRAQGAPARDDVPDYLDLDSDGDGHGDAEEAGDAELSTAPVDTDRDGAPDTLDLDSDGDAVLDQLDNCRITANPDQADENRNGIGNLCEGDDDGDGVLERLDNCPGVRNPDQLDRDLDGQGDLCDADANGDGLPDNLSVEGGCAAAGGEGALGAALVVVVAALGLRRRRSGRWSARGARAGALAATSLGLLASAGSTSALAQGQLTEEARDFSIERFRWSLDEQGILGVESASVPAHGSWGASLWLGYARSPLVVYGGTDAGEQEMGALVAYRLTAELAFSLALFDRFEVGVAAPLILAQDRDSMLAEVGPVAALGGTGFGDVRLTGKVALLRGRAPVAVALAAAVTAPSSTGADYRGEDGVTFAPEVVLARRQGRVRLGANLGWKLRRRTELLDLAVDDELYAQLGAGLPLRALPLVVESNLSLATSASNFGGRANLNHAELLAGVTYDLPGPLLATLVGGLGLSDGAGTPQWRTLLAVRFGALATVIADRDGDGLIGEADQCPSKSEDHDQFEDSDGCPEADNDRDGVPDFEDRLPQDPEDKDGFEDGDGAPDLDNDADGVPDSVDACRDDAEIKNGFDDNDGCPDSQPDTDGDTVRDSVDRCPGELEDLDRFEDEDGCPEADNDRDGALDKQDRCPGEAGPVDNAGCPDSDRDGDGVVDRLDNCPGEKGSLRNKGCTAKQLVAITGSKIEISDAVYFKSGRAEIERRSFKLLDNVAAVLRAHPEVARVEIEGHTDDQGDDAENKLLSQRRAEAVVLYLIGKQIAADRLTAMGYGEERPVSDNKRSRGRAANRRVVFRIVAAPSVAPAAAPAAAPAR